MTLPTLRVLASLVLAALVFAVALAGCSAASTPGGTGGGAPPAAVSPTAPGDDPTSAPGGGDPGGAPGGGPQGTLVFPKPGVIDPQPVSVQAMRQEPSDSHVVVRLDWTSGVEPCYTLAAVKVVRDGDRFTLTVLEGSTGQDVACIEIAQMKATLVDLGELPAGTYTVLADPGVAPPLTIAVP